MKEFCKDHKKELAFVILYLAYVYVACYVLYSSRPPSSYMVRPYLGYKPPPPVWTKYGDFIAYAEVYLPGLFLILAWISLINKKKCLYGLFISSIWVIFYVVVIKLFHNTFWIYRIAPVISILLPFLFYLGRKKRGIFWVTNMIVFLSACYWEAIIFYKAIAEGIKAQVNIFMYLIYFPFDAFTWVLIDLRKILKQSGISKIFYNFDTYVEKIFQFVSTPNVRLKNIIWNKLFTEEDRKYYYIIWGDDIDYYWCIRVFLLAAILILGIFLSYQRYDSKGKIVSTKKKQKAS